MTNTSKQLNLLSEVRISQHELNFAINRERGQVNQQETLKAHSSNTNWSTVSYLRNNTRNQPQQRQLKQPTLQSRTMFQMRTTLHQKPLEHVSSTKIHMPKMQENRTLYINKARMPERRKPTIPRQENRYPPQQQLQQTRRVRQCVSK